MAFFDFLKEPTKDELYEIEYDITSSSYFQNEIEKLMEKGGVINNRYITEKYNEKNMLVYKYQPLYFKRYLFDKDPKNPHDKNAIKIIAFAGMTSLQIGFIPSDKNVQFSKLKKEGKIYNVNLWISGGPKKVIAKNDVTNIDDRYHVHLKILFRK